MNTRHAEREARVELYAWMREAPTAGRGPRGADHLIYEADVRREQRHPFEVSWTVRAASEDEALAVGMEEALRLDWHRAVAPEKRLREDGGRWGPLEAAGVVPVEGGWWRFTARRELESRDRVFPWVVAAGRAEAEVKAGELVAEQMAGLPGVEGPKVTGVQPVSVEGVLGEVLAAAEEAGWPGVAARLAAWGVEPAAETARAVLERLLEACPEAVVALGERGWPETLACGEKDLVVLLQAEKPEVRQMAVRQLGRGRAAG